MEGRLSKLTSYLKTGRIWIKKSSHCIWRPFPKLKGMYFPNRILLFRGKSKMNENVSSEARTARGVRYELQLSRRQDKSRASLAKWQSRSPQEVTFNSKWSSPLSQDQGICPLFSLLTATFLVETLWTSCCNPPHMPSFSALTFFPIVSLPSSMEFLNQLIAFRGLSWAYQIKLRLLGMVFKAQYHLDLAYISSLVSPYLSVCDLCLKQPSTDHKEHFNIFYHINRLLWLINVLNSVK